MKVFIVEDSPALVQAVSELLSEIDGVEIVGSSGDAGRATEEIPRLRPDIVILDIRLAEGSGLDVLRSIKSKTLDSPLVIIFSSNTEAGYRRACERLGADFVFDKSQDYTRLLEVIRSKASSANSDSGENQNRGRGNHGRGRSKMATILIVDDDPNGLQYLDTLLGYQGHRMVKAGNANEALSCCRAGKPDLIITDVLMPELDGYQFVHELRKDKDLADVSVIFYTATYYRGKNSLALAEACGVARVLSKPAEPDTILEAVNAVLKSPGVSMENLPLQEFDRQHGRLIGSKLFNNVRKLDEANAQLRASEDQLRRLADHLRSAQEDERKRIARHLHDELGQALTLLKMNCTWIEAHLPGAPEGVIARLRSSIQLADDTISSVRRVATELRPAILDLGIAAAIEWQAENFQARTNIECIADLRVEDELIAPETATELFRIFQEALTNVLRHAQATQIHVALRWEDNFVVLEIQDNGKGISEERIANGKTLGLLGMRERAALVGGFFSVEGGKGTTVRIYVPPQQSEILH